MQYGDTQAYRLDDTVVILRKGKPAEAFDYVDNRLVKTDVDPRIFEHARAFAAWPSIAYRQQLYRLPAESIGSPGVTAAL